MADLGEPSGLAAGPIIALPEPTSDLLKVVITATVVRTDRESIGRETGETFPKPDLVGSHAEMDGQFFRGQVLGFGDLGVHSGSFPIDLRAERDY